jgi:hypothetical protein
MFEIANSNQSAPVAEAIGIDGDSASSRHELAATGGTVPGPPRNGNDGDYAAGLRALQSDARERGDIATGMRSTPLLMTIADVAAGQRTYSDAELVRGDFATGQRAERTATPRRNGQPASQARSRRLQSTVPILERA